MDYEALNEIIEYSLSWSQAMFRFTTSMLAITLSVTACQSKLDRPIRFVIPYGYKGPLVIIPNEKHPDLIQKRPDWYEVNIPKNGVLYTKNVNELERWHKVEVVYDNGSPFPTDKNGNPHFIEDGSSADGDTRMSWFHVGTVDEYITFKRDETKKLQWLIKQKVFE